MSAKGFSADQHLEMRRRVRHLTAAAVVTAAAASAAITIAMSAAATADPDR